MEFPSGRAYAKGLKAVGYHDLIGKPGFKMAIQKQGARWYLYVPALWESGFHILEITDPTQPRHVRFVVGHPNTWTLQVQIAEGRMITSAERISPGWRSWAIPMTSISAAAVFLSVTEVPVLSGSALLGALSFTRIHDCYAPPRSEKCGFS